MRARIQRECELAGRRGQDVSLVAATKGFGAEVIAAAIAANLTDIGENYYQEADVKFTRVAWPTYPVRKHFIGRLQRNKARRIAALFDVVQTVDDLAVAAQLDRGAKEAGKPSLDVFVQANISQDDRGGVPTDSCVAFAAELSRFEALRPRGLMAVGPRQSGAVPDAFGRAARAYDAMRAVVPGIEHLSLGMSNDMGEAIRAGSTMLRIGTALFGERVKEKEPVR